MAVTVTHSSPTTEEWHNPTSTFSNFGASRFQRHNGPPTPTTRDGEKFHHSTIETSNIRLCDSEEWARPTTSRSSHQKLP
ncbi:hypothetical protein GJ744_000480 [Endocarpon pusillum]|uniref:Uncharacterized protein n=1 Tax=Endocarpon pusillum TaxID=364733 RepID=A0A8H7ADW1_9EURO|nr:hypothetical protein GJ744_000480 [Endocarpon pusillum]